MRDDVRKMKLEVTRVPVSSLKLDMENLRGHGEAEINLIVRSLTIFGQFKPLIVDRKTMAVRIGNGRLMAMRKMGWTECDCILLDWDGRQGMEVADNRLNELCSGWQDRDLGKWFKDIGTDWWGLDDEMSGKAEKLVAKAEKEKKPLAKKEEPAAGDATKGPAQVPAEHLCPCCGKPLKRVDTMSID